MSCPPPAKYLQAAAKQAEKSKELETTVKARAAQHLMAVYLQLSASTPKKS